MKKAKSFIKNNIKLLIGLLIGLAISAGGVYAAIVIQGNSVGYTDNYSLGATTVQAAIDKLYTKAATGSIPTFAKTNSAKSIIATKAGIIFKRSNGNIYFIATNNWSTEQNHIKTAFQDIVCNVESTTVSCYGSDIYCYVNSRGNVYCRDESDDSACIVTGSGSMSCD